MKYYIEFPNNIYNELKAIDWKPAGNIVNFLDNKNAIIIFDKDVFEGYLTWLSAEKGMDDYGNINSYGIKIEKLYDEYLNAKMIKID
jgi:hypothetical protein